MRHGLDTHSHWWHLQLHPYRRPLSLPRPPIKVDKPTLQPTERQLTASQLSERQSLTSAQIQQYRTAIAPTLTKLKNDIAAHQVPTSPTWQQLVQGDTAGTAGANRSVASSSYNFTNATGTTSAIAPSVVVQGATGAIGCGICGQPPIHGTINADVDQDGLPDSLESAVADEFTPYYGSSAGEKDQFATFGNYVPMTVASLVGTVPPYSYYRVSPLGLGTTSTGAQMYFLRIDYLTLWNADDGLVGGGAACDYSFVGLDQVVQQLTGHPLDAERSGMIVGAPPVNGGYNPTASAYGIYYIYTAAHEGTFFDQSAGAVFSPAIQAGNHVDLALSLSKHSTYNFHPDYYPITPEWFVTDYYTTLTTLWADGDISDAWYYFSIAEGSDVFYDCAVERFTNQGGSYAAIRTNVGEPAHPINGSTLIQDDSSRALNLIDKLTNPLP